MTTLAQGSSRWRLLALVLFAGVPLPLRVRAEGVRLTAMTFTDEDGAKALRVTLTDFAVFTQSALNGGAGVDLVQAQEPGLNIATAGQDFLPDLACWFTLKVEALGTEPSFHRGDSNADGGMNITDAVFVLNCLFLGGSEPTCIAAADSNDDGVLNITDGIHLLGYLFLGGPPPAAPGPPAAPCGPDPAASPSRLGCEEYAKCP